MTTETGRRPSWRLPAVLAVLCAVLAVILYRQMSARESMRDDVEAVAVGRQAAPEAPGGGEEEVAEDDEADAEDFEMAPAEAFAEIYERPLFSETRRPDAPGADPALQQPATAATDLILRGVIVSPVQRLAILQTQKTAAIVHLFEGQEWGGWTVQAVHPDKVVMQRGATTAELLLEDTFRLKRQERVPERRRAPRQGPPQRGNEQLQPLPQDGGAAPEGGEPPPDEAAGD